MVGLHRVLSIPVYFLGMSFTLFNSLGAKHGPVIQTGITRKKIPCFMRDSAYRWFIVKKTKIF